MNACETCRHWTPPTGRVDFSNAFRDDDADVRYGRCEVIKLPDQDEPAPDPLPLAIAQDGSDYAAQLYTQAAFGCAMWESPA